MSILIDVLLAALVVVIIIVASKRGIMVTVAEVLAFVIAILLAAYTAKPIAKVMYKAFFYKTVQRELYEALPADGKAVTTAQKAQYAFDNMPEFVKKQAEKTGMNVGAITTQIAQMKIGTNEMYKELEDKVVRPIATEVLKHVLYFFLAIIYAIILRIIFVSVAKGMKQSDTIEKMDKTVGALIGVAEGLVVVFLICNLLVYIQPRIEKPEVKQAISDSVIVQVCEKFDPMEAISMAQAFIDE